MHACALPCLPACSAAHLRLPPPLQAAFLEKAELENYGITEYSVCLRVGFVGFILPQPSNF